MRLDAPPSFLGAAAAEPPGAALPASIVAPAPANVDISDVDPLAPRYKEWNDRAAQYHAQARPIATTLPFGGDHLGRDVLSKALKGTQISVSVGVLAAIVATLIGASLGAFAGFFGGWPGDFVEWLYNVITAVPDILLFFAFAAVFGRGISTLVLIMGLTGWTGQYRQVRAEFIKHSRREYVRAAEAIGASAGARMFRHILPNVSARDPGAHVADGGELHQGRGDPVVPRPGRGHRPGELGHDAARVAERADPGPLVAAGRRHDRDGGVRDRVLADGRRLARRARPQVAGAAMSAILTVENLQVAFRLHDANGRSRRVEAVGRGEQGISFDVPANTTVALVGESGSGKSVTAMALVQLLPRNAECSGRVLWRGDDLLRAPPAHMQRLRGHEIACVFQDPMSSLNPVLTIVEQIAEPLRKHLLMGRAAARARTEELLAEVGIPEARRRLDAYPHQLSGGQQQRVMIAMALACEPQLLIADEPTTALDVATIQRQILELLARLQAQRGLSMLFISHDLGVVGEIAQQVVVMRQGTVRERGPVRELFADPKDAYTKALLACRPRLDERPRRLTVIDDVLAGAEAGIDLHRCCCLRAAARSTPRSAPATDDDDPGVLQVDGLSKSFWLRRRPARAQRSSRRRCRTCASTLCRGQLPAGRGGEPGRARRRWG